MLSDPKSKQEIHRRYAEKFLEDIWSQGKLDVCDEILDDNFVFVLPADPFKLEGIENFKLLIQRNRTAFTNLTYFIKDHIGESNMAATTWKMSGLHVKKWFGVEGTNKFISINGVTIFTFKDGKITQVEVQNETLNLMQQLGVKMTPP
jgi:steroid delta-isomerase-like uncharacterized protein